VDVFITVQEELQERSDYYDWYALFREAPQCRDAVGCSSPRWIPIFERFIESKALTRPSLLSFVYYELGYFYASEERHGLAAQAYQQAIKLQPDYVSPYNGLGTVYRHTGHLAKAEELYRQCLELAPAYIFPYYNLGGLLYELGRYDEAEVFYRKAIVHRPSLTFSYFNFANFLSKVKRYDEAAEMYCQAIDMDPKHVNSYINLGLALEAMGQYEQAEVRYKQAIEFEPNNYLAHMNLGMLRAAPGQCPEMALESFQRCVEISPDRFEAQLQLARTLEALGRDREALGAYRQVADLIPADSTLKYIIVELCERLGRYDEALSWLEAYIRAVPGDLEARQRFTALQRQLLNHQSD
jgi:tetratricopeptide (TPR) repeat protein